MSLRVLLKRLAPDAGAAPRHFFPNHQTKLIAQVEHQAVLLVVGEADEVCAHLANQLHLLADQIVTHRRSHAGVVGMALGAAQEYAFAVQLEGAMLDKLEAGGCRSARRDASRPQGSKASPGNDRGGATPATKAPAPPPGIRQVQ